MKELLAYGLVLLSAVLIAGTFLFIAIRAREESKRIVSETK